MIRLAYHEHPDYVPLLRRAYELWREIELEAGEKLLHVTGGIYMGRPGTELITGALHAAKLHGLVHEHLDHGQLATRFPMFALPEDFEGVWEAEAGFLLPEKAIAAMAILAMGRGAQLHGHEAVLEWEDREEGVWVRTERGEYWAKQLIFTGGAWSGRLVKDLGVELKVTRQVLGGCGLRGRSFLGWANCRCGRLGMRMGRCITGFR